jgi:hypothetical protein
MMRRRVFASAAAVLTLAGVLGSGLHAYSTYSKWTAGSASFFVNPVNADVSQSAALAALQTAMNVWNTQSGSAFRFNYAGPTSSTTLANDGQNVVFFRPAANGSTIATTYSWWDGNNRLIDSDIVFWDSGFTFFTGTSGCGVVSNAAYIEDVATHEFGHALGLNHSTVADATMYPSYGYCSQAFRTLAPDDQAAAQSLYPGGAPPANTPPSVTITSPSNGASVVEGTPLSFSGSASDTQDGNLTASLQWTDNGTAIGSGGSFSRTLAVGTHAIVAWVADTGNLQASRSVTVTITQNSSSPPPPPPSGGTLTARGRKQKGLEFTDLAWEGLAGSAIDVYRNNARVMTTGNDGAETDPLRRKGAGTYTYRVCSAGSTTACSNTATVVF